MPYWQTESYSYDPASGAWEPLAGSVLTGTDLKPGEPYDCGGGQAVWIGTVLVAKVNDKLVVDYEV